MKNYQIISVPNELKFCYMSQKELTDFYNWYLTNLPRRIAILQDNIQYSDFPMWKADYSINSLHELGTWFIQQLEIRELTEEEIAAIKSTLSPRFKDIEINKQGFTDKTLSIIIDVGMYVGEVMCRNNQGLMLIHNIKTRKTDIDYGQPVISGFKNQVTFNPMRMLRVNAGLIIHGKASADPIYDMYTKWMKLNLIENK